jgi:5-methylcytosine-specific restriction enzyme A
MRRFCIVARSANTWIQMPSYKRLQYKFELVRLFGLACDKRKGNGCGKIVPLDQLSVDHIVPISLGGSVGDVYNMQLLCYKCHQRKTKHIDRKSLTFEFLHDREKEELS